MIYLLFSFVNDSSPLVRNRRRILLLLRAFLIANKASASATTTSSSFSYSSFFYRMEAPLSDATLHGPAEVTSGVPAAGIVVNRAFVLGFMGGFGAPLWGPIGYLRALIWGSVGGFRLWVGLISALLWSSLMELSHGALLWSSPGSFRGGELFCTLQCYFAAPS